MDIHSIYRMAWSLSQFRVRRMKLFLSLFKPTLDTRILDVGGTVKFWDYIASELPGASFLDPVLTNLSPPQSESRLRCVQANALDLPFIDGSFDVVFSNSLIEHLHTFDNQMKFANEVRRVGKGYFIQTPNRLFPVEAHYLTPFIHYFPKRWQKMLLKNFSVWGLLTRPTQENINQLVDEIILPTKSELSVLFPDADIYMEKIFGLIKAFVVYKNT